jgi:hypothetical protein
MLVAVQEKLVLPRVSLRLGVRWHHPTTCLVGREHPQAHQAQATVTK